MPLPTTTEDIQFLESEVTHGDDVYLQKYGTPPYDVLPRCMYFYYLGFTSVGLPDIRHYYYDNGSSDITIAQVPALIKKLAENAVLKDHVPPSHGNSFQNIVWRRKSYLALVMDSDSFKFWPQGLIFETKNGGMPNYAFYDAKNINVAIPDGSGGMVARSAFYCINHMKRNSNGDDLTATDSHFHSFTLLFQAGNLPDPWKYDPGGTNQGPPV